MGSVVGICQLRRNLCYSQIWGIAQFLNKSFSPPTTLGTSIKTALFGMVKYVAIYNHSNFTTHLCPIAKCISDLKNNTPPIIGGTEIKQIPYQSPVYYPGGGGSLPLIGAYEARYEVKNTVMHY